MKLYTPNSIPTIRYDWPELGRSGPQWLKRDPHELPGIESRWPRTTLKLGIKASLVIWLRVRSRSTIFSVRHLALASIASPMARWMRADAWSLDSPLSRTISQSPAMAIYNAVPPPQQQQASAGNWTSTSAAGAVPPQPPTTTVPIDVEAWAATALASLSIDAGAARGTGTPLSIPLDDDSGSAPRRPPSAPRVARGGTPKLPTRIRKAAAAADEREEDSDGAAALGKGIRRPPSRRDSQRRREALLKGREGTRQRRRWENGT